MKGDGYMTKASLRAQWLRSL